MDMDIDSLLVRSLLGTLAVIATMISYALLSSFIVSPMVGQLSQLVQDRFGRLAPLVIFAIAVLLGVPAGILVGLATRKD